MMSSLNEMSVEQVNPLVVGQLLPPSGIDAKYIKVGRNFKVFCATVPQVLEDLNAAEWKKASFLKEHFKKPPTGTQTTHKKTTIAFPYCLLTFGPAATSKYERLIVLNCWLNFSPDEQWAQWKICKLHFLTPTRSSELVLKYNPSNPKAIGSADSLELREQRAEQTRAKRILDGGEHHHKNVNDALKTNSQL
jgi:hypothetical protein